MKSPCSHDGSALDWALKSLQRDAPEQTRRARAALDVLLEGVRTSSWPEIAWQFSDLTSDGFPLLLTFSSSVENAVRYVLEIAGPEMPEQQRLAEAFRLYQSLTGRSAAGDTAQAMFAVQSGNELFCGAGLGGVHTKTTDRYKIYAEVPKGADLDGFLPGVFRKAMPLAHCGSRPVLLGYQPETGMREVYFCATNLAPEDIGRLLWSNHLGHRYHETLELVQATAGRPGATKALGGFSLAFNCNATAKAISLYTESRFLFGSDAHARRRLLKLAQERSWPFAGYEPVTKAHQNHGDGIGGQGVIAWIISTDNPVELRVSVRPPDPGGSWTQAPARDRG